LLTPLLKIFGLVRGFDFDLGSFISDSRKKITDNFASMSANDLAKSVIGQIRISAPASGDTLTAYKGLSDLYDKASTLPPYQAPIGAVTAKSEDRLIKNTSALDYLFSTAAAIECTRYIPYLDIEHQGQAEDIKDGLLKRFDKLAPMASDDLYKALGTITAEAMEILSRKAPSLARLGHVIIHTSLPSLVLAYDLYENLGPESDLALRNGVNHPGFMPAAKPLEYLINV